MTYAAAPVAAFYLHIGFYLALFSGLFLGSLVTALAHRLPRGISMITQERSRCPRCDRVLGFFDLLPVLSWLFLRGRCRGCGAAYGRRYLVIELATVFLCLAFYFTLPPAASVLPFYVAAAVVVALTAIDLEWQILPDVLNLSLALAGLWALLDVTGLSPFVMAPADAASAGRLLLAAVAGGLLYGGFALALRALMQWRMGREPMGLGDVKFFAAAGFWLGPDPMRLALFMMGAGAGGLVLGLLWRRFRGGDEFPFGPALIAVFVLFLLGGACILMPSGLEYVNSF